MREALHLLQQLDSSSIDIEWPNEFDPELAASRFNDFVEALQQATGLTFSIDTGLAIQDAPFHSQIGLPSIAATSGMQELRFSNFSNMVAVREGKLINQKLLSAVQELLEKQGYIFVPYPILCLPYTGKHKVAGRITTWWERYFDWS